MAGSMTPKSKRRSGDDSTASELEKSSTENRRRSLQYPRHVRALLPEAWQPIPPEQPPLLPGNYGHFPDIRRSNRHVGKLPAGIRRATYPLRSHGGRLIQNDG